MKGISKDYRSTSTFPEFLAEVVALNPVGGAIFYKMNGQEGRLIEPDLTERVKFNLKTFEPEIIPDEK